MSFIHPISLSSSFSISPRCFLSLSLISISHVLNCLFLLIAHSAPSFLSSHPTPVFFLLTIIFIYFALSLPRCSGTSSVRRLTFSLILSLLSCLSVSLSLSLSSTFIHLPFAFNLSSSSLAYSFFSLWFFSVLLSFFLQHSVSILHSSVPSTLFSHFSALFPACTLSLFLFPHYVTWRFSVHT
jgi:hypothetical protein